MPRLSRTLATTAVALAGMVGLVLPGSSLAKSPGPAFVRASQLPGSNGTTEPRVAVGPDDTRYVISGSGTFSAGKAPVTVYSSHDRGLTWRTTAAAPVSASPDVDIVVTRTGRLIATSLGGSGTGIGIEIRYSDNHGQSWRSAGGLAQLLEQDRPWLTVGGDDPKSHQPRVYLLFHNLFSGNLTQNMFISTSVDGGATFGAPVALTVPGSAAWLDLQCGSSTGPTGLLVNPKTGRLHAVWGVRGGAIGGCGHLPLQPATIVAQDRLWVSTSLDGGLGSWHNSLAVDDSSTGHLVGMQLAGQAEDTAGNVYVVYPEGPHSYPNFDGAGVRVRWAPPDLSRWSAPITIAHTRAPGNVLTHIVAGDPGRFDVAWLAGDQHNNAQPLWYATVAQVLNGLGANPTVVTRRLAAPPAFRGTASQLMGECGTGQNLAVDASAVICHRITDVWGVALDSRCYLTLSWPSVSPATDPTLGASVDTTWVDTQVGGPGVCVRRPLVRRQLGG